MARTEEEKKIAHREACRRYREKNPTKDKEYYEANKEKILADQKEKRAVLREDPEWRARQNTYDKKYREGRTEEQRQRRRDWEREYNQRPDVKKRKDANQYVKLAIKFGDLTRPDTCDRCGKECKPEAHHEDYDKPLDVMWLCKECHEGAHHYEQAMESQG